MKGRQRFILEKTLTLSKLARQWKDSEITDGTFHEKMEYIISASVKYGHNMAARKATKKRKAEKLHSCNFGLVE